MGGEAADRVLAETDPKIYRDLIIKSRAAWTKIKAVAYARISKLLGGDPRLQIIQIREYATLRGYEIVDEYIDDGISGAAERRPGLDRLVSDAKRGKYQVVITAALDRISRSTKHFLTLFDELQHYDVSIISLRENLDFTSPTGKMVATVLLSVATLEEINDLRAHS